MNTKRIRRPSIVRIGLAVGMIALLGELSTAQANHYDANWYWDGGANQYAYMTRQAWMNYPQPNFPNNFEGGGDLNASYQYGGTFDRLAVDSYGKDYCGNTGWVTKWHTGQRSTYSGNSASARSSAGYILGCSSAHTVVVDDWFGGYGTGESDWFYSAWGCQPHGDGLSCPHS